MFDRDAYDKKMKWFIHDRFGMFIHWGLYAIPARGEWIRNGARISNEDYQKYFDAFDPVDFDPKSWAKLAREAGMKYAVLTAKHHEGFCLFDSKLTDYKSTNTKCGRDLVREYIEAFRGEGLKVGLYYSLLDWHHDDYPHYADSIHPMRGNEAYKDKTHDFDNYLRYMHGQVEELCSNYGKIDLLWFDFSYDNLTGEAWKATELIRKVRKLQPDVIIDDRLEGTAASSLLTEPKEYSGDFISPEQIIPPKGVFNNDGKRVAWEACVTMNNSWGYNQTDKAFKPASMIIRKLAECVSKGGNLLLNVGPDAKGNIPAESVKILKDVAVWMKKNSESIYGCGFADIDKPDFGRVTRNGDTLYFHVMESTIGPIPLLGVNPENIKSVSLLYSGAELRMAPEFYTNQMQGVPLVLLEGPILPDETDTVVKVVLK